MGRLALTRKAGEGIYIGDDILVEIVTIRDGQVRVRITAPNELNISRTEGESNAGKN